MKRVSYVFPISHRFRAQFHELLRTQLAILGIEYAYIYSDKDLSGKGDTVIIEWGLISPIHRFSVLGFDLIYIHCLFSTWNDELVIIQQENRILSNYVLQVVRRLFGRKTAFFGHGRNFQAQNKNSLREKFKRFWLTRVDWWFAYTQRSADIVADSGFPTDRITVFNNAIDTSAMQAELATISQAEKDAARTDRFAGSPNIGVYIGGLYDLKRIDHMIESAIEVRHRVPDFQLMVIGGGPDAHLVDAATGHHKWIHAMGPRFGRDKTLLASLGRVFLMPGLVGLGVLDSFVYGTPMVTTDLPYHSPEIDYLKDGVNGVIVREADSVDAYATAVERILLDDAWRDSLRAGAAEALEIYTIEAMAQRFAEGVVAALEGQHSPP